MNTNWANVLTHDITIITGIIILVIGIIFKIYKYIVKEYYDAKKFLNKHKISEKDLKIESRKKTFELVKSFEKLDKKVDNLSDAFLIYVKANGVDKKTKEKVLKKLKKDNPKTLKVVE